MPTGRVSTRPSGTSVSSTTSARPASPSSRWADPVVASGGPGAIPARPYCLSDGKDGLMLRVESVSRFAPVIGFSKAVRAGNLVFVAGMTAIDAAGEAVGGADPYLQARESLRKALAALADCRADAADVVQTRMYLVDPAHWE